MQNKDTQMSTSSSFKNSHRVDLPYKIASYSALIIWCSLVLIPLWMMLINSFKNKKEIYTSPLGLPSQWQFDSYLNTFAESDFVRYFSNSITVTSLALICIVFLGMLAAYGIAQWRHRASRIIFFLFIAGLMIPPRIASINIITIVQSMGLGNSLWGLLPIYTAIGMPVAIFILTEFVRSLPLELIQAARIDGATNLRIFFTLILPLSRPAMATVGIYNLVQLWNDLWFPLILINKDSDFTLMLGVSKLFGQYTSDWSAIFSVLTLASLPVIVLYLLMSKQFIAGLTAGAVKG